MIDEHTTNVITISIPDAEAVQINTRNDTQTSRMCVHKATLQVRRSFRRRSHTGGLHRVFEDQGLLSVGGNRLGRGRNLQPGGSFEDLAPAGKTPGKMHLDADFRMIVLSE